MTALVYQNANANPNRNANRIQALFYLKVFSHIFHNGIYAEPFLFIHFYVFSLTLRASIVDVVLFYFIFIYFYYSNAIATSMPRSLLVPPQSWISPSTFMQSTMPVDFAPDASASKPETCSTLRRSPHNRPTFRLSSIFSLTFASIFSRSSAVSFCR